METNFNLYGPDVTNDFSTDYDYGSLMHYSPYAFSTNGEKTIETKVYKICVYSKLLNL